MLLDHFKVVDLTHALSSNVPTWSGSCGFCLEIKKDYDEVFRVQQIKMHAGVGTHMDAPSHRIEGGLSIAEIPLEQLIVKACVIDVSKKAEADYEVSVEDIENYEKAYGIIPNGSLVIAFTGWCRFWPDPTNYRNVDAEGQIHFPAFSATAAEFLLTRDIAGIAIDTLSPDCLDDTFPVHKLILGAGKYIIENIADCSQLPPKGAYVIALPLKAEESTESPLRIVALIPN
jgi:kynurenine formamidase